MPITSNHLGTDVERIPFKMAVGLGYFKKMETFRKFGMNPDLDAGTEEVWPLGTVKTLPTSAAVISIVSDDAADTAAGTGGRTIHIRGLDANYNQIEETVTLNGLTPVVTTQLFLRVNFMWVVTAGSGQVNAGNITGSIGGNPQIYVEAEEGACHCTGYCVPAEHVLYLEHLHVTTGRIGNADTAIRFQVKASDADASWQTQSDTFPYETSMDLVGIYVVPEKTDIRVLAVTTATNSNVAVEYDGFLIDLSKDLM